MFSVASKNKYQLTFHESKKYEVVAVCVILIFAAVLRFYNLRSFPGWYSDEGSFINFAENIMQGKWQAFAVERSPLGIGRPPLFLLLLAALFDIFGVDMVVLRSLTAGLGVVSVLLLYVFVRDTSNGKLALLSSLILAVHPWAVFYNRIGFTYNLLSVFTLGTIFASVKYIRSENKRWAILGGLLAGLGLSTDYLGVVLVMLVVVVQLFMNWRYLVIVMGISALPLILTMAPSLVNHQAFLRADTSITYHLLRTPILTQFANIVLYYGELVRREGWVIISIVGFFFLPKRSLKAVALFVICITILLSVRTIAPVGRNFHYLLQLLPIFSLGLAAFFSWLCSFILENLREDLSRLFLKLDGFTLMPNPIKKICVRYLPSTFIFIFIIVPLMWMSIVDFVEVTYGSSFTYWAGDDLNLSPEKDVDAVTNYLSDKVSLDDVVIASPQILWAVPSQKVEFFQLLDLNSESRALVNYVPFNEFAFNYSPEMLKYVVLDPLITEWAAPWKEGLPELLDRVQSWPLAFKSGDLEVYINPLQE